MMGPTDFPNVRFWGKADMTIAPQNLCLWPEADISGRCHFDWTAARPTWVLSHAGSHV